MRSVPKSRILADIQIQQDILAYLQAGNHIVTRKPRKSKQAPLKVLAPVLSHIIKL
jgi:hypothetical protein